MATIVFPRRSSGFEVYRADLVGTLMAGWRAMRQHREAYRTIIALSRKPPRLLQDMGIDPERLYEALDGTSDEVGLAHFSRLLRSHHDRSTG